MEANDVRAKDASGALLGTVKLEYTQVAYYMNALVHFRDGTARCLLAGIISPTLVDAWKLLCPIASHNQINDALMILHAIPVSEQV